MDLASHWAVESIGGLWFYVVLALPYLFVALIGVLALKLYSAFERRQSSPPEQNE